MTRTAKIHALASQQPTMSDHDQPSEDSRAGSSLELLPGEPTQTQQSGAESDTAPSDAFQVVHDNQQRTEVAHGPAAELSSAPSEAPQVDRDDQPRIEAERQSTASTTGDHPQSPDRGQPSTPGQDPGQPYSGQPPYGSQPPYGPQRPYPQQPWADGTWQAQRQQGYPPPPYVTQPSSAQEQWANGEQQPRRTQRTPAPATDAIEELLETGRRIHWDLRRNPLDEQLLSAFCDHLHAALNFLNTMGSELARPPLSTHWEHLLKCWFEIVTLVSEHIGSAQDADRLRSARQLLIVHTLLQDIDEQLAGMQR